jgi:hypothetical protein
MEGVGAPPEITQISAGRTAPPQEEYLPFVQDFVRSGNWSDVATFAEYWFLPHSNRRDFAARYV